MKNIKWSKVIAVFAGFVVLFSIFVKAILFLSNFL